MNNKFQISQKGFNLIELLVVMAILGIFALTSFALLNPANQLRKARDSRRKTDLAQLQATFELYRSDQGSYPTSLPACGTPLSVSETTYIKSVPCDPNNRSPYIYTYTPSGGGSPTSYSLIACFENVSDPQKDAVNVSPCDGINNSSYTVTNP